MQSCCFGLGIIAQRVENGKFIVLKETLQVLIQTFSLSTVPEGIDDETMELRLNLVDNSISCLFKIILF